MLAITLTINSLYLNKKINLLVLVDIVFQKEKLLITAETVQMTQPVSSVQTASKMALIENITIKCLSLTVAAVVTVVMKRLGKLNLLVILISEGNNSC